MFFLNQALAEEAAIVTTGSSDIPTPTGGSLGVTLLVMLIMAALPYVALLIYHKIKYPDAFTPELRKKRLIWTAAIWVVLFVIGRLARR